MDRLPTPEISVVIATYNRREMLATCLDALAKQTQDPASFEVVVADDGSKDGTSEMVETMETPLRLRALRLENGGWAAAANAGARAAAAPLTLQIDDDVIASPALVAAHLAAHREADGPVVAIGRLIQRQPHSRDWFVRAQADDWNRRYEERPAKRIDWPDCYGANFSAPSETLAEVGGFSTDRPTVADMELAYRLAQAGCAAVYIPEASALHDDEKDRARLIRDIEGFGGFCAEFTERHPETQGQLLGWFGETTPREVLLRRALLALRATPAALAKLGPLVPAGRRREVWYGFIARFTFWRAVRAAMSRHRWLQTTRGLPVLMYHAFTDNGERSRFVMPADSFERQMRLLSLLRYRVVSLDEVARTLRRGEPLPRHAVAITIDDGYEDNLRLAQPVLRRHRYPATLFAVSDRIGARNDWDENEGPTKGRPLLGIEEIERMRAEGTAVGAHTRTHRALAGAPSVEVGAEVEGSRQQLEAALGAPVTTFAYPYGEVDEAAVQAVAEAGFEGACTTRASLAHLGDDPLRIPRLEIEATDTLPRFLRKLWFGGR